MFSWLWIQIFLLATTTSASLLDCKGGSGKIPRLVPHPNNCRRIFACTDGRLQEYSCPEGEVFIAKDGECRKQEGCKKVAVSMQAYESCPEVNGPDVVLFPHPTECGMYYQCDHGVAYPRQCPKGLHYNPKLRVCDWPKNADCKARFLVRKS
ncbi:peritrophin-1-like [Uloborus diversus]|uniref:peritrophin-1-like n=1 Tax=Uloborus diversus TaxID=327109 RepID=UPI002409AA66|nr:peritrophin-1-like [Uloborus diversus]